MAQPFVAPPEAHRPRQSPDPTSTAQVRRQPVPREPDPPPNEDFWERFARRHGRELVRCVHRAMLAVGWCAQREDIDDLVQEVYCRLLARRRAERHLAGRPPAQQWVYLQRVSRSVVVDALRGRGARKRGGGAAAPATLHVAAPGPPSPGVTIEERLLARERADLLRQRVRALFPGEQGERNLRVLELAAVEGLTSGEISQRLAGELSPSSVHTVLYRIRRQLAGAVVSSTMAAVG
jgi:RNA polymerase sigma factor (sigma-70 family)